MRQKSKLPLQCPSCENRLLISELVCRECGTKVSGNFDLPVLLCLNSDEQEFVVDFVKQSGSIKDMSMKLGLSYPTVRNMLDAIIEKIVKRERETK